MEPGDSLAEQSGSQELKDLGMENEQIRQDLTKIQEQINETTEQKFEKQQELVTIHQKLHEKINENLQGFELESDRLKQDRGLQATAYEELKHRMLAIELDLIQERDLKARAPSTIEEMVSSVNEIEKRLQRSEEERTRIQQQYDECNLHLQKSYQNLQGKKNQYLQCMEETMAYVAEQTFINQQRNASELRAAQEDVQQQLLTKVLELVHLECTLKADGLTRKEEILALKQKFQEDLQICKDECTQLRQQHVEYNQNFETALHQLIEKIDELQQMQENVQQIMSTQQRTSEKLNHLRLEKDHMHEERNQQKALVEELEQRMLETVLELREEKCSNANARRRNEEALASKNEIQQLYDKCNQELQRLHQQLHEKNSELQYAQANMDDIVEDMYESQQRADEELEDFKSKINLLEQCLKESQELGIESMTTCEELRQQILNKDAELKQERKSVSEMEEALASTKKTQECLRRSEEQYSRLENEQSTACEACEDLRQQILSKDTELKQELNLRSDATTRMEEALASMNEMQENLRRSQEEYNRLQEQYAECNQELKDKDAELQGAQRDWILQRTDVKISGENIGEGAWGWVKEGLFRGTKVAVKQMHQVIVSPHNRTLFEREMMIASRCRHPNLLQFIGATNDDGIALFVTELLETDLRMVLFQRPLHEKEVVSISLDVSRGLNYLHLMQPSPIIHRDISSANVLLWKGDDIWRAKLSDYGAANFMQQCNTSNPGAAIYAAPEAQNPIHSPKVDVFSFGLLMCEMQVRSLPDQTNRNKQIKGINNTRLRDLVQRCTQVNPGKRPTMQEIISSLDHVSSPGIFKKLKPVFSKLSRKK